MPKRILNIIFTIAAAVCLVPIGVLSYTEITKLLGYRAFPVEVAGTGSMYPSFFWDQSQGGPEKVSTQGVEEYRSSPRMYHYFRGINLGRSAIGKPSLKYGDIVAFKSATTRTLLLSENKDPNLGFIKRIIGMPGDTIELRDGYVLRNSEIISEPYIRSPRSTYGDDFVHECKSITVPANAYFVLGDNRKVSSDSRSTLGFVNDTDIQFYLPLSRQKIYQKLWRETSQDQALSGTPTFNPTELYAKIPRLTRSLKLENSSRLRAEALIKDPTTKFNMSDAINSANYHNTVVGEFVTYGHYTADELWETLRSQYETNTQIDNPDYSEIGITAINGEINGCPTQVIVGHLGGYVPPTYPPEVIQSWQQVKNNLVEVIPSWEKGIGETGVDQQKLALLLSLLKKREALVNDVLGAISRREWMSDSLKSRIAEDNETNTQIANLITELNQAK